MTCGGISASLVLQAMDMAAGQPDVLAIGGWHKPLPGYLSQHLFMVAAMAPAAPLRECMILVWEGEIGAFYHWQNYGAKITPLPVLAEPGSRYAALFALADPTFWDSGDVPRLQDAGKIMALTAYAAGSEPRSEVKEVVEEFMKPGKTFEPFEKISFQDSALYNCGVDSPLLHTAARYLTNRLFETFR
ncbi:hypothetical protein [Frankia sp. Cas3]|uniref:hypothetical protein n=1 Tax=Frankia sp. Cas3 TaxID=3073926 RepID=UPI002AD40108|nr:hypothetical protein [Frankia sp. Cas3]